MSDETGLMTLQDTMGLGGVLAKSGYFEDTEGEAQAVVKILAGREMGFGPIASMSGVYIVKGKPTIGANLMGAAVKRSGRYDYRVVELTEDRAEIAFTQGGVELGRSVFTMADAQKAGLANKPGPWKQYPRNMLFSRAMSNGARWYCPDVLSGVTPYTPEEMAEIDGGGDVIDVTPTVQPEPRAIKPEPEQEQPTNGDRPFTPDKLQTGMRHKAGWLKIGDDYKRVDGEPVTENQFGMVAGRIEGLFTNLEGGIRITARHDVMNYLFSIFSTKNLTKAEASALIDWTEDTEAATQEAAQILEWIAVEAGQRELD